MEDCANLGAALGMELFPWQRLVLDDWCSFDASQKPSYVTCGLDVSRQNGKNASLELYEMYRLAVCGWHVLHTAHRVKTTKKAFHRLVKYFTDERHPEMCGLVTQIRRTNGEEGIFLANGGQIEFSSRTNGGSRGFDDIQLVVFDEAQELTDSQFDAISYTLSASSTGERQTIYMGTPPNETSLGTVFARQRRAALAGDARNVAWNSWATEELPRRGSTFEDVLEDIYASNPSMGYVLDIDYTRSEFMGSDITGFAHERLDWWSSDVVEQNLLVDAGKWKACEVEPEDVPKDGKVAYGVKFTPDGKTFALSVCQLPREGVPHVELLELDSTTAGLTRLTQWLMERKNVCAVCVIDGRAGAQALMQRLHDGGFPRKAIVECSTANAIAAASGFVDAVNSGQLSHVESPAMDDSATKSIKRVIGRNGAFGFGDGPDSISAPVESAALALWGAKNTKRDPKRKAKVHV